MSYLSRLHQLDYRRSLAAEPAPARVVLLTGQSSFRTSRLSEAQTDFLRMVAPPASEPLFAGFPFHPDFDRDAPEPNLLAASLRNGWQFAWSLWSPTFQQTVARALQPLFHSTHESLQIVTGSCGLQLLAGAWPRLTKRENLFVRIVALGPTLLRPYTLDTRTVFALQGRRDLLSRWCYRGGIAAYCDAGHLDYWQSAETRRRVAQLLRGAA
jgi:hypothetical protein